MLVISKLMEDNLNKSSLIRQMFEKGNMLRNQYGEDKVFDFSLGNPDREPPKEVVDAFREVVNSREKGIYRYMSNAGYFSTRKAVADNRNLNSKTQITPDLVVMTVGAAGAINVALKTLLDPGDEVIVVTPYFVEYFHYIRNHGGIPVIAQCNKGNFDLDIDAIRKKITPKTKGIIINSPNNPSGAIYSEERLRDLNNLLLEYNRTIYVIADEPYKEIVFGDNKTPEIIDLIQNVLICYSWSKSLALPGARIGYLAVSPECEYHEEIINAAIVANRILGFVNAPGIMQKAIEIAVNTEADVEAYERRARLMYEILSETGYECMKPAGSLYLFPKSPIEDDMLFADIASKHNLLIVPGSAFGMEGHFRVTFCVEEKTILNSKTAFSLALKEALG
jgi:aspartate aminotransferase